jgi:predicted HTH domain antitoxin
VPIFIKEKITNNLIIHLKLLEKQEQANSKTSRWEEIIKIMINMYLEAMLSGKLSLSQASKTLCLSYYFLCFLLKKTGVEGRTGSAWK